MSDHRNFLACHGDKLEWTPNHVLRIEQLERELAEAKEALGNWKDVAEGMSAWKDELLQVAKQRDQWREVAEALYEVYYMGNGSRDEALDAIRKLKEASRE